MANQLFATLDPTVRRVKLAGVGEVVLADTVGFVRALPHELIAAFRSTLQEARDADLLLHVVDASDPLRDERIVQVREVLRGIGAGDIRELLVFNKIDLDRPARAARVAAPRVARRPAPTARGTSLGLGGDRRRARRAARGHRAGGAAQSGRLHAASCSAGRHRSDPICTGATPCAPSGSATTAAGSIDVELDAAEIAKLLGAAGVELVDATPSRAKQRVA